MMHYATYSRSQDCFSANCPKVFTHASGCHVWSEDGREFIDWGMALRSVILGYANEKVDFAVKKAIDKGISFTRSNPYEGELKELLKSIISCAEEVKFAKNGSDVTSAAVKLARAYTGRQLVLMAEENPFYSQHDWAMSRTHVNDGIITNCYCDNGVTPKYFLNSQRTSSYSYSNIYNIEKDYDLTKFSAIILDPSTVDITKEKLQYIRDLCDRYGIIMILDEVISGFRYFLNGVQGLYGVTPDLSTFGKAMGNGYSVSALCGKKELFDLGLRDKGNVFLLSGTYFSETTGLAASIATIKELIDGREFDFIGDKLKPSSIIAHDRLQSTGNVLLAWTKEYIEQYDLSAYVSIGGHPTCPMMKWNDLRLKTIFDWKMIEQHILMPYIAPSLSHKTLDIYTTTAAMYYAFEYVKSALEYGDLDKFIYANCGNWTEKPVFRRT
jgi:glutamate-1-semialdehyde 2,1-aminomutase